MLTWTLLAAKEHGRLFKMKKTFKTLIAVAALSGTVGANVQAAEITVKKGDTIWDLSQVHNESVENIKSWNNLSSDLIYPGDVIITSPEANYSVKDGDSLWEIARNYNVHVNELMKWNQLDNELIKPGMKLMIFKSGKGPFNIAAPVTHRVKTEEKTPEKVESVSTTTPVKQPAKPAMAKPEPAKHTASVPAVSTPTVPKPAAQKEQKPAEAAQPVQKTTSPSDNADKEISVLATAYTANCEGCSGVTTTGINLKDNPDAKVISVDPSIIPLGSKVFVEGYGYATAGDTGGSIKGNRIDVFIPTQEAAEQWGSKQVTVKIIK